MVYTDSLWTRDAKIHGRLRKISPKVSGEITSHRGDRHQFVHAGDLLFTIDDTDYNNNVSDATFSMLKAESELNQAKNVSSNLKLLGSHRLTPPYKCNVRKLQVDANRAGV
ncbi:biotin/lipoyl-binding protein [Vibrio lentus]|nr:biotin/lipoyl-binding protein [Vibrio lentus]